MRALLALDLGTKCGWAVRKQSGEIFSGEEELKNRSRFEGGGMRFLRWDRFLDQLHEMVGFQQVTYEEVRRHLGVDAAHAYGGYQAHLMKWCEVRSIPYSSVPVGTIKKFAAGTGKAKKGGVIEAMRARGHTLTSDNEADALALLYWMIQDEATSTPHQRPPLHSKPSRRVPLDDLEVAPRPVRRRAS